MSDYDISLHYWLIGDDKTQVYASSVQSLIPSDNPVYQGWLAEGGIPTRIDNLENLKGVFAASYPAGWPGLEEADQAAVLLTASDRTVLRCYEQDMAVPEEWVIYRALLRQIITTESVPDAGFPERPAYPVPRQK